MESAGWFRIGNSHDSVSMDTPLRRADVCSKAVRKPVGYVKPDNQNTCGHDPPPPPFTHNTSQSTIGFQQGHHQNTNHAPQRHRTARARHPKQQQQPSTSSGGRGGGSVKCARSHLGHLNLHPGVHLRQALLQIPEPGAQRLLGRVAVAPRLGHLPDEQCAEHALPAPRDTHTGERRRVCVT
jgi:hypothetical protein